MNVYRFINSKDIREHLEFIKYPFGSLEAAWIIYQCRFASLEEKHAACEQDREKRTIEKKHLLW